MRPSLLEVIATTPGVAPYFDLSFQHASPAVLRRMRRFGSRGHFLDLLDEVRRLAPTAGVRTNVIVGFPGESEDDVAELEAFLAEAGLDAVGVFGFSPEEGTEAAGLPDQVDDDVVAERVERVAMLADELVAQRAEVRVGESVRVLVLAETESGVVGLADHQGPDVDGTTTLRLPAQRPRPAVGALVPATVVGTDGVDLVAEPAPIS
jgi:tRNA A37 methylthiotransferase MiaB